MYTAPTEANPMTGQTYEQVMKNAPDDCCETPSYEMRNVENVGNRAEADFRCQSCGNCVTEVFTIRYVEREDGERFEANQSSYGDEDEAVEVVWAGKTSASTLVFVGKGSETGMLYKDVYKYYSNEY
jgi:hypothetical protein